MSLQKTACGLLVSVMLLSGCGSPGATAIEQAKTLVVHDLLDPSSAQFRDLKFHERTGAVCGELNAKNRMGGYTGFRRFYVKDGKAMLEPEKSLVKDGDRQLNEAVAELNYTMGSTEPCEGEQAN